ncbi:MAG: hypothetical protein NC215_00335 [Ruminococcus sp.]|nr:hypothetical protein [Ruminococcus sp.]
MDELLPCGCGGKARLVVKKLDLPFTVVSSMFTDYNSIHKKCGEIAPVTDNIRNIYKWRVECARCNTGTEYYVDNIVRNKNGVYLAEDGRQRAIEAWNCAMGTSFKKIDGRIHGKWLTSESKPNRIYCSVCHQNFVIDDWITRFNIPNNYCPNCGADMMGEQQ